MTGEMRAIRKDGTDSNGDCWELHAAIAKEFNGQLRPFDVYQGPYILIGHEILAGSKPYAVPVNISETKARLWLVSDDGQIGRWYDEISEKQSEAFLMVKDMAVAAAGDLLSELGIQ